jgi:hypothetical protein
MGSRTPKLLDEPLLDTQPPPSSDHSVSDRLNQLAAAAWATEQDLPLTGDQRKRIQDALRVIEECLGEGDNSSGEDMDDAEDIREPSRVELVEDDDNHEELRQIQQNLRATVESMRLRQQEQRHLNQISLQKLESVAQTCIVKERRAQELSVEVQSLRIENNHLGEENNLLRDQLVTLESQATQKDVAVNAMSSAVAGLEGWVNSSPSHHRFSDLPPQPRTKRGRYVVRGKGRFRGRHYLDEEGGEIPGTGSFSDTREFHDGVRAWLRGFRDVEEELQRANLHSQQKMTASQREVTAAEEDWGEFEAASEA